MVTPVADAWLPRGPLTVELWSKPSNSRVREFIKAADGLDGTGNETPAFFMRTYISGSFQAGVYHETAHGYQLCSIRSPYDAYELTGRFHLTMTYDGERIRLFVNGVEQPDTGECVPGGRPRVVPASVRVSLGVPFSRDGRPHSELDGFNGKLDEVAIYDRALPADVVFAHHRVGAGG